MVLYKDKIEDKLNDIFLFELSSSNSKFKYYQQVVEKLQSLDKIGTNHKEPTIHAWKLAGWYQVRIGNRIFGYSWDGENACIEETYLLKRVGNKIKWVDEHLQTKGGMLFENMDYYQKRQYISSLIIYEN